MSDDPYATSEWADYVRRARNELIPKITDSAVVVSLVPNTEPDVKYATELGMSIMLDKPILAIVRPGTEVPVRLRRAADRVVEVDLSADGGMEYAQKVALAFMDEFVADEDSDA